MSVGNKVRIYDLAKELKQDTKRVMEELRREGADISVPSNSVPKELADKVRNKYFPKKETAPARAIKVIKKVASAHEEVPTVAEPLSEVPVIETAPVQPVVEVPEPVEEKSKTVVRAIKLKKPVEAAPVETEVVTETAPVEVIAETVETPVAEVQVPAETAAEPEQEEVTEATEEVEIAPVAGETRIKNLRPVAVVAPPPADATPVAGTQVKQLRLTKQAIDAGMKQGERIVSPKPVVQTIDRVEPDRGRDRNKNLKKDERPGRRTELRGTPGETATPQTVYTPPADARKKFGRNQGKKGDKRGADKGGRFNERDLDFQRPRSIEERILDQVGKFDNSNLKSARMIEGATIRDFAEKIGVTPRDIVQLLIKKELIG